MTPRIHIVFGGVSTLVVAAPIAWGFVLAGTPAARREERFDEQRVRDLKTIAREIQRIVIDENNAEQNVLKEPLPKTLAEAARRARNEKLNTRDPETGEPYRYTLTGETTYELCATFSRALDRDSSVFWNHPAGEQCFTVDVLDPPPAY